MELQGSRVGDRKTSMLITRFCVFIELMWKTVLVCRKHTLKQVGVLGHLGAACLRWFRKTEEFCTDFQLFPKFKTD